MKHVTHYVLQGMRKSIKMPVNYERVKGVSQEEKENLDKPIISIAIGAVAKRLHAHTRAGSASVEPSPGRRMGPPA